MVLAKYEESTTELAQPQMIHISSHDGLQIFMASNLLNISPSPCQMGTD